MAANQNGGMEQKYIILSNSNILIRVNVDEIAYITSDGSYSVMVLDDGRKHVFSFNLSAFEKQLERQLESDARNFIRLGKSLIINSHRIYCIDLTQQQIVLSSHSLKEGFTLTASREALKTIKSLIENQINNRRFL